MSGELDMGDPRRLLPKPEFDPAKRRSGFPAYVSPRSRLQSNLYSRWLRRFDKPPEQEFGLLCPRGWELAREQWLERQGDRRG